MGGEAARSVELPFRGRLIHVPLAVDGVARFDFADLCVEAHAAADFLEITKHYRTIIVEHIPVMGAAERNHVKRFINLVDTLYDAHAKLIVSAAAEPEGLYTVTDGTESFEFQRTISRLREMRSQEYIATQHLLAVTSPTINQA
jgi:cell division protein ZapE